MGGRREEVEVEKIRGDDSGDIEYTRRAEEQNSSKTMRYQSIWSVNRLYNRFYIY